MGLTKRFEDWWSRRASKGEEDHQLDALAYAWSAPRPIPPRSIPPNVRYNSADVKLMAALYPLSLDDEPEEPREVDVCWRVTAMKDETSLVLHATPTYARQYRVSPVAGPTDRDIDALARSMMAVLDGEE